MTKTIGIGLSLMLAGSPVMADQREDAIRANAMRLPDVRPELLEDAITAALGVETPDVPAELLLALAWHESRFEPGLRTGKVCGALQVVPAEVGERDARDACHRWSQDTWQGFEAGAKELRIWLKHAHGDMAIALRGRACGWVGLTQSCGKEWWIRLVRQKARELARVRHTAYNN